MKTKLFISLDGPLLVDRNHDHPDDPFLEARVASYAQSFLHWAKEHFSVQLLTDRNPNVAFHALEKMGLKGQDVPVHVFEDSKTEHIHPNENFVWVDSDLIPGEASWLIQHGKQDHFIRVDPEVGVTAENKKQLEKHLPKRK